MAHNLMALPTVTPIQPSEAPLVVPGPAAPEKPGQATPARPDQAQILDSLLRNESDVAYRRRVRRMVAYLELDRPVLAELPSGPIAGHAPTVLDCGMRMGFYSRVISELGPDIALYGIDYEEKVLRYAQHQLAGRRVVITRGDIHHLNFADDSFDRVVMSEVLEHLADDSGALQQVHRVMKPGAILALTVPNRHYPYWYDPINRVAEDVFRRPVRRGPFAGIWANHERLYDRQQVVDVITRAGFVIDQVEELTHYCFPATQTLVYTVGKGLIEHNLLPVFIARSTHRFQGRENRDSPWNPINWVLGLFHWIDHFNENPALMARQRAFVNIAVKARKV
jgi:SAM-dependent methyltransferase